MSLLRRYRSFRRLWAAGAVSLVGDWLSFVAVSMLALESHSGALGLAIVYAAHALPAAVLAPVAGALVDRIDRRRALIGADLIASAITAAMALAALAGSLALVQILLLARSAVSVIVPTAESAAVRRLVDDKSLLAANSILAATWSVAYVVGMALGGVAALLGPALALALDAASFLLAAAGHATLPPLPVDETRSVSLAAVIRATPQDTVAALRVAVRRRSLFAALLAKAPLALAGGAGWIALSLVSASALPFGAAALSLGVLQAIRGAGTGIGPACATWLAARGVAEDRLHHAARALMLVAVAALAFTREPVWLCVIALAWGTGSGTNWVLAHAGLQRYAGDDVIGRLAAFDELLVTCAMVASAFLGAIAAELAGAESAALVGAVLGVLGLVAAAALVEALTGRAREGAAEPQERATASSA